MSASSRLLIRLVAAGMVLAATHYLQAQSIQSMMLRNNQSPASGQAINRGDFNNDGILDLVTVNASSEASVSVYLGRADGTFNTAISTNTGAGGVDLAVGDFNKDGKLDVATVNLGSNIVQVLLGNGDGTFQPPITLLADGDAESITVADFNNDGKLDLAVGQDFPNEVEIFEGDGTGHFTRVSAIVPTDSSIVTRVRVGDFNRDGKVDIAVLQEQALVVLFGNGDLTFQQVQAAQYAAGTNDMSTGDFNQDSFTDILVSWTDALGSLNGGVDVFYGGSVRAVNFQRLVFGSTDGSYESPRQLVAADVDGDGINDIVGLDNDGSFANGVYVWHCTNTGFCNAPPTKFIFTTDRDKEAMVAGDFNRDGKIDFAATLVGNSTMEVLLNATPRAPCQKSAANFSMTVCQPQQDTFSNSPLHIVAQGNSSNTVTDINVYIDNILQGQFASSSIDKFFNLSQGDHFVVVKGFDSTGTSFRSGRNITVFNGAPGQTCATTVQGLSIHMCLPEQNATLHSPVQVFANAYSPRPLTAIQVYIDNVLVFNDPTASEVNKLFSLAPGSHFIVTKAFDANGNELSDSRTISVQ